MTQSLARHGVVLSFVIIEHLPNRQLQPKRLAVMMLIINTGRGCQGFQSEICARTIGVQVQDKGQWTMGYRRRSESDTTNVHKWQRIRGLRELDWWWNLSDFDMLLSRLSSERLVS